MLKEKVQEYRDSTAEVQESRRKSALLKLQEIHGVKDKKRSAMVKDGVESLKQSSVVKTPPSQQMENTAYSKMTLKSHSNSQNTKLDKFLTDNSGWIEEIPTCPVFYPSKAEFEDPLVYISTIASVASKYGICKIVSPLVASVPAGMVLMKEKMGFQFTTRVQPLRMANWDGEDKIVFSKSGRNYTFREYEKMANKEFVRRFSSAANLSTKFMEEEFWCEMSNSKLASVEYACDIDGSAFSGSQNDPLGSSKWNLKDISRNSMSMLRFLEAPIPGITEPMLYMGMLFSMFAWHVEDHYLYSLNYHHCGAPKTWYGVPGYAAHKFENVVREHVYDKDMLSDESDGAIYDLLIGKTTMFPPGMLSAFNVPVFKTVQYPGEFIVTFPRAYHAGFSHGFNCGEAVNFALLDWLPFGEVACKRYEFLSKVSLIPHEQLLCKEAMCLGTKKSSAVSERLSGKLLLKVAFVKKIMFQHQMIWLLKKLDAKTVLLKEESSPTRCYLCKQSCYISYLTCNCHSHPVCLNHVSEIIKECVCGFQRQLFLREDFPSMVSVAKRFDQIEGVLNERLELPARDHTERDELDIQDRFDGYSEFADYYSYCHIRLDDLSPNKVTSRESSSSCEPRVQKRQNDNDARSKSSGDAFISNTTNEKDISLASNDDSAGHRHKKHKKLHRLSEMQQKRETVTGKAKVASSSSFDSPKNQQQVLAERQFDIPSQTDTDMHQVNNSPECHVSETKHHYLLDQRFKINGKNKDISRLSKQKMVETSVHKGSTMPRKASVLVEEDKFKLFKTPDGERVVLISDILSATKAGISNLEIFRKWKMKLQTEGIYVPALCVDTNSVSNFNDLERVEHWGLSPKGCRQLLKVIEKPEVHLLQKLLENTFGGKSQKSNSFGHPVKLKSADVASQIKRKFSTMDQMLIKKNDVDLQEPFVRRTSNLKSKEHENEKFSLHVQKQSNEQKNKASESHRKAKSSSVSEQGRKVDSRKETLVPNESKHHVQEVNKTVNNQFESKVSNSVPQNFRSENEAALGNQVGRPHPGNKHPVSANGMDYNRKKSVLLKRNLEQDVEQGVSSFNSHQQKASTSVEGDRKRKAEASVYASRKVSSREENSNSLAHAPYTKSENERKQSLLGSNRDCPPHSAAATAPVSRGKNFSNEPTIGKLIVSQPRAVTAYNDIDGNKLVGKKEDDLPLIDIDLTGADLNSEAGLSNLSFSTFDKSDKEMNAEVEDQSNINIADSMPAEHLLNSNPERLLNTNQEFQESVRVDKGSKPVIDDTGHHKGYLFKNNFFSLQKSDSSFVRRDDHIDEPYSPGCSYTREADNDLPVDNAFGIQMDIISNVHAKSVRPNIKTADVNPFSYQDLRQNKYSRDPYRNLNFTSEGNWRTSLQDSRIDRVSDANCKPYTFDEELFEREKAQSGTARHQNHLQKELHNVEQLPYQVDDLNQQPITYFKDNHRTRGKEFSVAVRNLSSKCFDDIVPSSKSMHDHRWTQPAENLDQTIVQEKSLKECKLIEDVAQQDGVEACLEYENGDPSVIPYSPSSFGFDYPLKPSQANSLSGRRPKSEHNQWSQFNLRKINTISHNVMPDGTSCDTSVSCEANWQKDQWVRPNKGIAVNNNDSSRTMHTVHTKCSPSNCPDLGVIDYGQEQVREVFEQATGLDSQIPSYQGKGIWTEDINPIVEETGETSNEIQTARRGLSSQDFASPTVSPVMQDVCVSDNGYWPSFVRPARMQEDELRRKKLLIEKWGRA